MRVLETRTNSVVCDVCILEFTFDYSGRSMKKRKKEIKQLNVKICLN